MLVVVGYTVAFVARQWSDYDASALSIPPPIKATKKRKDREKFQYLCSFSLLLLLFVCLFGKGTAVLT